MLREVPGRRRVAMQTFGNRQSHRIGDQHVLKVRATYGLGETSLKIMSVWWESIRRGLWRSNH